MRTQPRANTSVPAAVRRTPLPCAPAGRHGGAHQGREAGLHAVGNALGHDHLSGASDRLACVSRASTVAGAATLATAKPSALVKCCASAKDS
jgi:hypothetical protein